MRPIDAIKYGENLVWLVGHGEFSSPQDSLRRALYDLAQTPTLTLDDLRPKERWDNGTCSNCGQVDFSKPNFCPHCGADMRGGGEDA